MKTSQHTLWRALSASILSLLLVAASLVLPSAVATAAPGDVASATMQWGVKASFRNYLSSFAGGHWSVSGSITDATPFSFSGGTGTADATTGSAAYAGSIHFQGHEDFGGIGAGNYALDLTMSNVRLVRSSATAATLVVDTHSNSIADPATFVTSANVAFATVDLASATDNSTADTAAFAGAPSVLTADGAAAFAGFYAAGTALDPVSFSWPIEQAPVVATPTITVSQSTALDPDGQTITVTGSGFSPVAPDTSGTRPPLAGKFGGVYVAFGTFLDIWKPSESAPSSARKANDVKWVVEAADVATVDPTGAGTAVALNPDGSFTLELEVERDFAGALAAGNYGIYTYGGSGASYAAFETATPLTFATAPAAPSITVSQSTALDPDGQTITVTGSGFSPVAPDTSGTRPPLAGKFGGVYVAFGTFLDTWKPSESAPSSARKANDVKWVVEAADVATVDPTGAGTAVALNPDGSFTLELEVERDFAGALAAGNYGIYTYGGSGASYAAFETATPLSFATVTATTTTLSASPASGLVEGGTTMLTATVAPVTAGTVEFARGTTVLGTASVDGSGQASHAVTSLTAGQLEFSATFTPSNPTLFSGSTAALSLTVASRVIGAGSLDWGIKQSFRSYVTSSIAHGSISTSGASYSGSSFHFGQASGGSFSAATGLGSSLYSGTVRFQGHSGLLDVSLGSPTVTITSASSATLSMRVNGGSSIPFATLALSAGTRSTPSGAVRYSNVPATLTSQGAAVFAFDGSAFYSAGESLDPVSFTIGAPSSGGGSAVVASFAANTADATPPSSTGISLPNGEDPSALTAGETYEFEASGFGAGEQGILAVLYSTPTVLASDIVADETGSVRWTGTLPESLSGEHTFTFQGSVDRGLAITVNAVVSTAAMEGCMVTDAALEWGFKESFRSYVSGSIAHGEWTVADGASYETPLFGWTNGEGSYDAATEAGLIAFTGSITFTGHDGVLNTTVANPQIRFEDAETAYLVLDVTGTTQEGEAIDGAAVDFVRIDLKGATLERAAEGRITINGAPTTLTSAGAAAFGTYPSGEAFDALTLSFSTASDCAVVAIAAEDEVELVAAETDFGWLLIAAPLALIALIIAVTLVVRRRQLS